MKGLYTLVVKHCYYTYRDILRAVPHDILDVIVEQTFFNKLKNIDNSRCIAWK